MRVLNSDIILYVLMLCMGTGIGMDGHICMYTHTYIHTYRHIHRHTHTQMNNCNVSCCCCLGFVIILVIGLLRKENDEKNSIKRIGDKK
uniref:Bm132 n=1 Tax=Brugia malayi TaxID=6279 RepID=A0A1I9FZV5_BRUMA|nr:Bm132 [Brugia malayi]